MTLNRSRGDQAKFFKKQENSLREQLAGLREKGKSKSLFDYKTLSERLIRLWSGWFSVPVCIHRYKCDFHDRIIKRNLFLHFHHNTEQQRLLNGQLKSLILSETKSCGLMNVK